MPQGHPGQLLCWDRGLHHLCSKRGKRAYALSQCTQQGEAHPIYLVTCSLFWVVGGKWFSRDKAAETDRQAKRFVFYSWTLRSPEWRDNRLSSSLMLLGEATAVQSWRKLYSQAWVTLVFVFVLHKVLIFLTPQAEQFVIGDKKEARYFWYNMQETGWGCTHGMYSSVAYYHKAGAILTWPMTWTSGYEARPGSPHPLCVSYAEALGGSILRQELKIVPFAAWESKKGSCKRPQVTEPLIGPFSQNLPVSQTGIIFRTQKALPSY